MQQIETRLRAGMATNGITGAGGGSTSCCRSRRSRSTGFRSRMRRASRCSSMRARISRRIFPRRSTRRCSTTSRWGSTHPATLVKDAQRHGVRFAPIDVQISNWNCFVQDDGAIRLGLRFVRGLREQAGKRIEDQASGTRHRHWRLTRCNAVPRPEAWCLICAFRSMDELVARAGLRQDELRTLAEIGALASLGGDRRSALWQAERAGRPAGPLLMDDDGSGTRR